MSFMQWFKNQDSPAAAPAPQPSEYKSIESLPDAVKARAVEAARPAAEVAGSGAVPKDAPVQPQATPNPRRGLVLGR
jgi:hypothetical protein